MSIDLQSYLTRQIENVVQSTAAARSMKPYQMRILALRIARLMQDELSMTREAAMEAAEAHSIWQVGHQ